MNRILALLSLFFLFACDQKPKGQFGWAAVQDDDLGPLEQRLLMQTEFKLAQDRLFFHENDTIWWIFRLEGGFYNEDRFLAALYTVGESPEPVEIDLRQVIPESTEKGDVIRQYYEPLEPGRYVLKIAYESVPISQVEFTVLEAPDPWDDGHYSLEEAPYDDILHYSTGDPNYDPI